MPDSRSNEPQVSAMISRRRMLQASAFAGAGLARPALAQQPGRTVFHPAGRAVSAGGSADSIARVVRQRLEIWGQQVTIENRGGASGNLAAENVAHSPPDGYTMFIAGDFHAVNLFLFPKLTYDPVADFAPVSLIVNLPTPSRSPRVRPPGRCGSSIALAKTRQLTFAAPGLSTSGQLTGELFMRAAGIQARRHPPIAAPIRQSRT